MRARPHVLSESTRTAAARVRGPEDVFEEGARERREDRGERREEGGGLHDKCRCRVMCE